MNTPAISATLIKLAGCLSCLAVAAGQPVPAVDCTHRSCDGQYFAQSSEWWSGKLVCKAQRCSYPYVNTQNFGCSGSPTGFLLQECCNKETCPTTTTTTTKTTTTTSTKTTRKTTTTTPINTNIEAVLEGSFTIATTNASWLATQPNFSTGLGRAIGNMSMVDEDDVYIRQITALYPRRLTIFALHVIDQPIARALQSSSLTVKTASGLRINFEVRVRADGLTHITATTISNIFNSQSIAEASEVINIFLATTMFGHPLNVQVSRKFIKIKESTAPAPAPSPAGSRSIIVFATICASLAAACCFALPIKIYLRWKQNCPNKINEPAHTEIPIESNLLFCNTSASQLMCVPIVITREDGYAIRQLVSSMLDPSAKDAAHVAISFSPGTRDQDVAFSGPGVFHAAAIIKALHEHDIRCCISECWLAGNNVCEDQPPMNSMPYRMLVVLESCALYKCGICLEQIHAALLNGVQILRLQTDARLPFVDERWPQHRESTPEEVEDVISRLDASPAWSEQPITDSPDGVYALAQDVRLRLQLGELQRQEGRALQAFDGTHSFDKEDSLLLPEASKKQPQELMVTSVASSLVQALSSLSRGVKHTLLEPLPERSLLKASEDAVAGGKCPENEQISYATSKSRLAGQTEGAIKKARTKKNAAQVSKNGRKAAAAGGDEGARSPARRKSRQNSMHSSKDSGSTSKVKTRRKDDKAKIGHDAVVLGKDTDGHWQSISDANMPPKPVCKEERKTIETKTKKPKSAKPCNGTSSPMSRRERLHNSM